MNSQNLIKLCKLEDFKKEREIFEIDNSHKLHFVHNNSEIDRIHLLVDWLPS